MPLASLIPMVHVASVPRSIWFVAVLAGAALAGCGGGGTRSATERPSAAAARPAPSVLQDSSAAGAARIVETYYQAIDAKDYVRAYALWGPNGPPNGQTFEAFVAGFGRTAHVTADVGPPGGIEGAAGSQYVTVSVTIQATMVDGGVERYGGTYAVRRAVADGATPEQRRWHLYTAAIRRVAG